MEDEFFFSLLRISVAQILKALGFDRCKPSVLNIITDLYIKHFQLVIEKAQKFAIARTGCTNDIAIPDIYQAFIASGFIRPLRFGTADGKPEIDESNTRSGEAFLKWVKYSDSFAVSKALSEVPPTLIHNLMEKRRIDTSTETDQERKKRKLKERQEYYNQLKQGEEVNQLQTMGEFVDELDEDDIKYGDRLSWLTYLAEKDLKLGHNLKFVNSCIQESLIDVYSNSKFHPRKDGDNASILFKNHIVNSTKNDYILLQAHDLEATEAESDAKSVVLPSQQLKDLLPYNIKYNLVLFDDNLDQFIAYATAHLEEIEERLNNLHDSIVTDAEASVHDNTKDDTGDCQEQESSCDKKFLQDQECQLKKSKDCEGDAEVEEKEQVEPVKREGELQKTHVDETEEPNDQENELKNEKTCEEATSIQEKKVEVQESNSNEPLTKEIDKDDLDA